MKDFLALIGKAPAGVKVRQTADAPQHGVEMTVVGVRTSTGEVLILACHGMGGSTATEAYLRRRNFGTGFEKLNSHGFHMESSRLRGDGKMEVLLATLAIAMAWSYSCGTWSAEHVTPIRLKKHGRQEHSIIARGPMLPGGLLHGIEIICVILKYNIIFQRNIPDSILMNPQNGSYYLRMKKE